MDPIDWQIMFHVCTVNHFSHRQLCVAPWTVPARLLYPGHPPGKITALCCHVLLQGTVPTQGPDCMWPPASQPDALPLAPAGKPGRVC